ncbi:class I SAM-dependent methyltransferase [Bacillus salitolerans]|uniref:Class I SAM-dependent methyltransferase n=1 Tax=Bacillus salitolerans TaxID=1437434 RepID=A0ABW4LKU3_9BACI
MEGPIIYELIGDYQDKIILDLGCEDASFGKELLDQGVGSYTGIEGSKQMADSANRNIIGENGRIQHGTMESYSYPNNEFDIVTSRFAFHYVSNINELFDNVYKTLKHKGKFIFSVQHPLTTSSFISKDTGDKRGNWIVDDYFIEGERREPWIEQTVVKYHRSIEQYFKSLTLSGFTIVDLREGAPKREHFSSQEEFERRQRIPVVLIFSCIK